MQTIYKFIGQTARLLMLAGILILGAGAATSVFGQTPNLSINDVSLNEGSAGTTAFNFTVNLSSPASAGGVTFDIATANGTAVAPSDYTQKSLTSQLIPAGNSTYTFTVLVNGDTTPEANETFFVNVINVTGASVSDGQGQGTIVNDDAAPNLSINDVSLNEGNSGTTAFTFTVNLSAPAPAGGVTFDIATANGTAVAPGDYTSRSLTSQVIPAGSSSATFTVQVNGDTTPEANETFFVNVTNVTNAITSDGQGQGTIVNDDFVQWTVTKTADTNDGVCNTDCSLREAIAASGAGDTIQFASPLFDSPQTITLSLGELGITGNASLTINGTGANRLSISGNNASRVFFVGPQANLTLNNLTVTGGSVSNQNGNAGAGIYNNGTTTLTNSTVSGNSVPSNGLGAGITNSVGTLTVINSTISGNFAPGGGGGGILNDIGTVTLTNSTISGNTSPSGGVGGGIFNVNGTVTIKNSTITGNSATDNGLGGGIYNQGTVNVLNTIIAGNTSDSGADYLGTLTSQGNNLIGNAAGATISGTTNGNILNQNAQLLPLGNYGGTTQTHALLPNSPAVNNGTATGSPTLDQRGKARVGATDIGAFEAPANLIVTNTGNAAGSLRDAIFTASETTADESISFQIPPTDAGCANGVCTINLNGAQLTVNSAATAGSLLIANATGALSLRVSGNNQSRVFNVNSGGNLTLDNLTVMGGRVTGSSGGAGIFNNAGALTITNSTISGNAAIAGGNGSNNGGGIFNINGNVSLANTTVSGNSATGNSSNLGGGISNILGTLTITNCTISGNSATGGDINAGGGIDNSNGTTVNARNTIISGNTAEISPDLFGSLNANTNNLIGGNALLAPLGFYGGGTQTHALLSNSPAVNAGNTSASPTLDQRGAGRVGNVDIGAFELNNSANGGNFVAQLPTGTQNVQYSYTLIPEAGSTAYCILAGNLPAGLSGIDPCPNQLGDGYSDKQANLSPSAALTISGTPTQFGTSNFSLRATNGGNTNITDFTLNILGPTAANVSVSGRVLTNTGRGLRNAVVTMTDSNGEIRTARSNTFGYYRFTNVGAGETYVFAVNSKQFTFTPQVLSIADDLTDLNFIAVGERILR